MTRLALAICAGLFFGHLTVSAMTAANHAIIYGDVRE